MALLIVFVLGVGLGLLLVAVLAGEINGVLRSRDRLAMARAMEREDSVYRYIESGGENDIVTKKVILL